ncbi:MAG: class I SAM-dependent methyltransferase [Armatimonadetes bacterium]|nr:class I SAM-dependent methyltransferase [Armatimonadota bacterium]
MPQLTSALWILALVATLLNVAATAARLSSKTPPAAAASAPDALAQSALKPTSATLAYVMNNNNDVVTRASATDYLKMIGVEPGDSVADIGCGTGFHVLRASEMVGPKGIAYAIDLDPEEVRYVEGRAAVLGLKNVRGVVSGPVSIPLPPATLDKALLVNVLHCIITGPTENDPKIRETRVIPFLKSIRAVLKPGALLLVFDQAPSTMANEGGVSQSVVRKIFPEAGFTLHSVEGNDSGYTYLWRAGGQAQRNPTQ